MAASGQSIGSICEMKHTETDGLVTDEPALSRIERSLLEKAAVGPDDSVSEAIDKLSLYGQCCLEAKKSAENKRLEDGCADPAVAKQCEDLIYRLMVLCPCDECQPEPAQPVDQAPAIPVAEVPAEVQKIEETAGQVAPENFQGDSAGSV